MNIPNLSVIFTPVIFQDFNQSDETITIEWSPDDLFEDLILHYEILFPKAEESARKNNEFKLNQALNGLSPFNKFSQSNLLYLSNSVTTLPSTSHMLLTQPMTPPVLQSAPYEQPYPPKLTTVIGTTPTPTQRSSSIQHKEPKKKIPPRHDSLSRKREPAEFDEKTLEEPPPTQYQAQFNPDHVLPTVTEDLDAYYQE
jgi:hypothetical protein